MQRHLRVLRGRLDRPRSAAVPEMLRLSNNPIVNVDPLDLVVSRGKIECQNAGGASLDVDVVFAARSRKRTHVGTRGVLYRRSVRPQIHERERMQKTAQYPEFAAESGATASGTVRRSIAAVLMAGCKRIIQVVEHAAAGEHEIPGLLKIELVILAVKAGLIAGQSQIQAVVPVHSGRESIVKV